MFRRDYIPLLEGRQRTLRDLAGITGQTVGEVADDLAHLKLTLKRAGRSLLVEPARCRKCGFTFGAEKLSKPSRCPDCRATWIEEARIGL